MGRAEKAAFALASVFFLIFLINLMVGALRSAGFLNDISDALFLFGACIAFVAAVLLREQREKFQS